MKLRRKQSGAVAILVVVGMVAILAMAGLALDSSHAMLNKTRLQNAVDAAALSGAKELDRTGGDVFLARDAVEATFGANGASIGNNELGKAYADGIIELEVQFSKTLDPFVSGTSPAEYVRVRARNFRMSVWFATIVGATDKVVAATAVAGPSPTINTVCNIAPMMVCGDPSAGGPFWGYKEGEPDILKTTVNNTDEVGPGNFQLIRLGDVQGGADLRLALAGNYDGCATAGEAVETEPGNKVEPVATGINTRFGNYGGSLNSIPNAASLYPPDVITKQPSPRITACEADDHAMCQSDGVTPIATDADLTYNYEQYQLAFDQPLTHDFPSPIGHHLRRELALPIGDCSETTNGQGQVPVLGFGCFFLLQEAGTVGNDSYVFGQFIRDCNAGGMPGPAPIDGPGPYIIQLYKDPDSPDA